MKLGTIILPIISSLTLISATSQAASFSVGPALGSNGFGAYISIAPDWQLGNGVIQARLSGGTSSSKDSTATISTDDFKGTFDFSGVQLGLDWYPSASNQFFVSAGVLDFDRKFDVTSKADASYTVGDKKIVPSDNVRLTSKVDHQSTAPYVSVGWGNRRQGESGFTFLAELGAVFPRDDADIDLSVKGNTSLISAANLNKFRKETEDDLNDVQAIALIGVGYHF